MHTAKRLVLPLALVALFLAPLAIVPLAGCGSVGIAVCGDWWCVGVPIPPPCDPYYGCRSLSAQGADLNGDGSDDLVYFDLRDGTVKVRLADGAGGLGEELLFALALAGVDAIRTGDFDGNGTNDVAFLDYESRQLRVLLGNGAGALPTTGPLTAIPGSSRLIDTEVGPLDAGAATDVMVLDEAGGVTSLLADGAGGFTDAPAGRQQLDCGGTAMSAGLMDADAVTDLVVVNEVGSTLCVYGGSATGAFTRLGAAHRTVSPPRVPLLGELDGNAGLDVAVFCQSDNTALAFFGDGAGGLTASSQGRLTLPLHSRQLLIVPDPDTPAGPAPLVILSDAEEGGADLLSGLRNNGAGGFGDPELGAVLPADVLAVVPTDVEGDGRSDLVIFASHGIYVAQGGPGQD